MCGLFVFAFVLLISMGRLLAFSGQEQSYASKNYPTVVVL